MLDAIKDTRIRRVYDSVVPLIIWMKRLRDSIQQVHGKQHGLHLSQRRYGAESRANKANESNCWLIRAPDLPDICMPRCWIGIVVGVFGFIEKRKRWEVASGKYHDVWLDYGLVDADRLWTAVEREVGCAVLGDVRRSWCDFDDA